MTSKQNIPQIRKNLNIILSLKLMTITNSYKKPHSGVATVHQNDFARKKAFANTHTNGNTWTPTEQNQYVYQIAKK
jgi:hypothetical protein